MIQSYCFKFSLQKICLLAAIPMLLAGIPILEFLAMFWTDLTISKFRKLYLTIFPFLHFADHDKHPELEYALSTVALISEHFKELFTRGMIHVPFLFIISFRLGQYVEQCLENYKGGIGFTEVIIYILHINYNLEIIF